MIDGILENRNGIESFFFFLRLTPHLPPMPRRPAARPRAPARRRQVYRRRTYTRRPLQAYKAPLLINPRGHGMPEELEMKLMFSGVKTFQGISTTNVTSFAFKANGMYDPDPALGGKQPNNFDQMMALYTAFYVKKATIKVWCAGSADINLNTSYLTFNVFPYGVATATAPALGQFDQISTWTKSKTLILTPIEGSRSMGKLTLTESYNDFFGGANPAESENQGSAAADPTRLFYFIVTCYQTNQITPGTYSGGMNVQIEYDAVFISPRQNID